MDQSVLESDISDIAETTKVLEKINKVKTELGDHLTSKANQEKVTQDNLTKIFVKSIESNTLETSAISPDATKIAVTIAVTIGDVVKPFMPLIESVTIVISEIIVVYENVKYYKEICDSLMVRVEAAEKVTKTLKRRLTETEEENFYDQEFYKSFIRFVDIMKQIKKFMVDVSNLNSYQKFLYSGSFQDRLNSLAKDFDVIMTELNFTMVVANFEQKRMDQCALESDTKGFEKINKVKSNQEKVTQDNSTKIFIESIESNTLETSAIKSMSDLIKVADTIGEVTKPFVPLIESVNIMFSEIFITENVQYNKKICNSLMDRVDAAETAIKALKRRLTETEEENFHNQEYYKSFIRLVYIIKRIKTFIADVSNLNGYQKFLHSGSIKDRLNSLAKDFDVIMTELNFTMAVANFEQKRMDQCALESDISDTNKGQSHNHSRNHSYRHGSQSPATCTTSSPPSFNKFQHDIQEEEFQNTRVRGANRG
ncbi:hypothetical protein Glove_185g43 [Diversispora epigaea]|uniref:Uncharacterized protein n=1 Tax=Diversispora epigaea TaxID=1348612 RepID=A0A397IS24_9GLOM|nr:hypothetical protein Glove_185g43 [Diversispora epigaea]